ncbi:MAG: hypothetical protein LZ159_06130, partial [Thaumarchaeota archaeon]|nr:hypothetical protein [Candidatus Terraquivivens yellowstonensis]
MKPWDFRQCKKRENPPKAESSTEPFEKRLVPEVGTSPWGTTHRDESLLFVALFQPLRFPTLPMV